MTGDSILSGPPQAPPIPVDPALAEEEARAQEELVSHLQTESRGDTASLMAMYGSRLAMAGSTSRSPMSPSTGARV